MFYTTDTRTEMKIDIRISYQKAKNVIAIRNLQCYFNFSGHRRASSYGSSVISGGAGHPAAAPMQLMRGHSQSDLYGPPPQQLYNPYFCKQSVLKSRS